MEYTAEELDGLTLHEVSTKLNDHEMQSYIVNCVRRSVRLKDCFQHAMLTDDVSILRMMKGKYDFFQREDGIDIIGNTIHKDRIDILDFLLEEGLDVDTEVKPGFTLLFSSLTSGGPNLAAIKLLEHGASVKVEAKSTDMILNVVVACNLLDIFDRLIIAGLDLHYYRDRIWEICFQSFGWGNNVEGITQRMCDMGFPLTRTFVMRNLKRVKWDTVPVFWKLYGEDNDPFLKIGIPGSIQRKK